MFKLLKFILLFLLYIFLLYLGQEVYNIKEPAYSYLLIAAIFIGDVAGWFEGFFEGLNIYKKYN